MLVKGKWEKDFHPVQSSDEDGSFIRDESCFRNWITSDGSPGPSGIGGFKAEADRYHLYVALICPWASRTLMVRKLKGLEGTISVTVLDPVLTDKVWRFGGHKNAIKGAEIDPIYGSEYMYELYLKAKDDYTGQITVPVLWDKKNNTIVNNESSEIIRMLNDGFNEFSNNDLDLYPLALRHDIDTLNDRLYDHFNNGVYRAGFASTQKAYAKAVKEVTDSLEFLEETLTGQDYLVGNQLTEADVRVFVTLIRFDLAYHGLFKINKRQAREYPNIRLYMQRIYALDGIEETVNIEHIKAGYYSIKAINPTGIVPIGPENLW